MTLWNVFFTFMGFIPFTPCRTIKIFSAFYDSLKNPKLLFVFLIKPCGRLNFLISNYISQKNVKLILSYAILKYLFYKYKTQKQTMRFYQAYRDIVEYNANQSLLNSLYLLRRSFSSNLKRFLEKSNKLRQIEFIHWAKIL